MERLAGGHVSRFKVGKTPGTSPNTHLLLLRPEKKFGRNLQAHEGPSRASRKKNSRDAARSYQ